MNKVIKLECMIGGVTSKFIDGKFEEYPCKTIQYQMAAILESNHNYKFVSLVYHPSKASNMEYASLIVEINEQSRDN